VREFPLSLAQTSGIESRIALRGNHIPGGGQETDNIALRARDDALAKPAPVSVSRSNNIKRQRRASFGKFVLALLKALENIIRLHGHATALFLDCIAARNRSSSFLRTLRVSKVVVDTED
jgi:hypothetical protein